MKQLGNLTMVCARRADTLLEVRGGTVRLAVGEGAAKTVYHFAWDDDETILGVIYALNHGGHRKERAICCN